MLAGLLFEMETSFFTEIWDQWVAFHTSHASGSSIHLRVKSGLVSVGMIPGLREHALSPKHRYFKQSCQPESCDWKPHSAQSSLPPEPVSHAMALTSLLCAYAHFIVWHTVGSLPSSASCLQFPTQSGPAEFWMHHRVCWVGKYQAVASD